MRVKDESKIEAIYQATLSLVKEKGLAGITMSDISKEASIATGTLYIYFENKTELIRALFSACRASSAKEYFSGIDEASTYEDRLEKVFNNIIRYKMLRFEVSAFLEQTYHSPYICITDVKKKQTALQPLFDLFKEGMESKKIKQCDEAILVSYFFGVINEMVKKTFFSNKKLRQQDIDQLYGLFWDGLRYR